MLCLFIGINCEKCVPYFYRPESRGQGNVDACMPCDCKGPGITVNTETGLLGDCIINNDKPLLPGKVRTTKILALILLYK